MFSVFSQQQNRKLLLKEFIPSIPYLRSILLVRGNSYLFKASELRNSKSACFKCNNNSCLHSFLRYNQGQLYYWSRTFCVWKYFFIYLLLAYRLESPIRFDDKVSASNKITNINQRKRNHSWKRLNEILKQCVGKLALIWCKSLTLFILGRKF